MENRSIFRWLDVNWQRIYYCKETKSVLWKSNCCEAKLLIDEYWLICFKCNNPCKRHLKRWKKTYKN